MESCQYQCCLGNRERRTHLVEMLQLLVGRHHLHGTQVNRAQRNAVLLRRFHVHLQRRLSVQLNGQVHHISALHQAVGWGIRPSPGYVDTHRAASPHNLVRIHRQLRLLTVIHCAGQSLTHQAERPCLQFLRFRIPLQLAHLRTEHRVADTLQQRSPFRQFLRQGDTPFGKRFRRLLKVHLIEHAPFLVLGQQAPVLLAEHLPLGEQPSQVCIRRNLVGRYLPCLLPDSPSGFTLSAIRHPLQHRAQILY